ncbi:MAG: diguanylate cyclase [Candidatus Omnitrophota bacterium]|jgi:diguanylate cyclase (GGDEF)-like protein|nr:MAG: diguanylate cyclase [Candidatus Omnitrophota bacterium]
MSKEKQTILIVDDERLNIDILGSELGKDYHIIVAKNGNQAVTRIENNTIDLVLLDIIMPELDGYETIKLLKNHDQMKHIPVIFITSKQEDEDEAKGLQLGAVDYIRKPFNLPIVRSRVKTHLDLKLKTDLLEKMVSLDGLTNIYNRRKFDEMLDQEWKRATRAHTPLSIILIDIDFFKNYNDFYGHTAGDDCLRKVARGLKLCINRPEDFLGRYGGEEFVVLLPNTNAAGAKIMAEKLRQAVENLDIPHSYSPISAHVTISLGVAATIPVEPHDSGISLVESADRMLYESKKKGRNQVQCSEV